MKVGFKGVYITQACLWDAMAPLVITVEAKTWKIVPKRVFFLFIYLT